MTRIMLADIAARQYGDEFKMTNFTLAELWSIKLGMVLAVVVLTYLAICGFERISAAAKRMMSHNKNSCGDVNSKQVRMNH